MDNLAPDLTSSVVFVSEAIRSWSNEAWLLKTDISSEHFLQVTDYLGLILRNCFDCAIGSMDDSCSNELKLAVFQFLVATHLNLETFVPCKRLSLEIIVWLAIDNQLVNASQILSACFKQKLGDGRDNFDQIQGLIERILKEKLLFPKSVLFSIDLVLDNFVEMHLIENISSQLPSVPIHGKNLVFEKLLVKTCDEMQQSMSTSIDPHSKLGHYLRLLSFLDTTHAQVSSPEKLLPTWSHLYTIDQSSVLRDPLLGFMKILQEKCQQVLDPTPLNHHFVIKNRLPGFDLLLDRLISEENILDENLISTLMSCQALFLDNSKRLNSIVLKLNTSESQPTKLKMRLRSFFWDTFDLLQVEQKVEVIHQIQANSTIRREKDGSVCCLLNQSEFNHELILFINKSSTNEAENFEIINSLAKLFCVSLETVTYRIVIHFLSNKEQIRTLEKILETFSSILTYKNLLVVVLKNVLVKIVKQKSEKYFQNYLVLLSSAMKSKLFAPSDIFDIVLKSYFDCKSIQLNSLIYALEILDLLIEFITPDHVILAYLLEILTSLDAKLTNQAPPGSQIEHDCLNLKEKCLLLINKMASKYKICKEEEAKFNQKNVEWFNQYSKNFNWVYVKMTENFTTSLDSRSANSGIELAIELVALGITCPEDIFKRFLQLDYDHMLFYLSKALIYPRTNFETLNILEALFEADLPVSLDSELGYLQESDSSSQVEQLAKFLKLFIDLILVLRFEKRTDPILLNLIRFIKKIPSINDGQLHLALITSIYFGKILHFMDYNSNLEILKFLVELSNRAIERNQADPCKSCCKKQTIELLIQLFSENSSKSLNNLNYLVYKNILKIKELIS